MPEMDYDIVVGEDRFVLTYAVEVNWDIDPNGHNYGLGKYDNIEAESARLIAINGKQIRDRIDEKAMKHFRKIEDSEELYEAMCDFAMKYDRDFEP